MAEDAVICTCPLAGYCERHKINKGETWHLLCQTNRKYFEAWEQGYGPGQRPPEGDRAIQPNDIHPNAWVVIHARLGEAIGKPWDSASQQKWYKRKWLPTIPRTGCACQNHWQKLTDAMPIDWSSAETAFHSLWQLHNYVSEHKSNKPTMTLEEAQALYIPNKQEIACQES